jgi:DNA-binding MarR family transcriptional regulator
MMSEVEYKKAWKPSDNFVSSREERERIKALKEAKISTFLLEETFSTSARIAKLIDTTQTTAYRTLKKMELQGLVKMHEEALSLGRSGKQVIWGLTPTGALLATDIEDENFRIDYYEVGRVKPVTLEHSLDVQDVRIFAEKHGWTEWRSSRKVQRMAHGDRSTWLQVPDALAISPDGFKTAFEIERTVKTPKRYDAILTNYALMIKEKTIDEILYISPEKISSRLEKLFKSIPSITIDKQKIPVSDGLLKRFHFLTYEKWKCCEKSSF